MPLQSLKFQPGINREVTAYTNEGGWRDCDKIRFRSGLPEKIGGWTKLINGTILGKCRAIHPWSDLNGAQLAGLGTSDKYYVYYDSSVWDITPLRYTAAAGATTFAVSSSTLNGDITADATSITLASASGFPVQGYIKIDSEIISYGSVSSNTLQECQRGLEGTTAASHTDTTTVFCSTITVTEGGDGHGASDGDYVTFSAATSLGGVITADVLNQEYKISLPAANAAPTTTYYINARTVEALPVSSGVYAPTLVFPNASDTGNGGASTVAAYQIPSGLSDAVTGLGWGAGGWGEGGWSEPVLTVTDATSTARIWTHDNYGEDLLICPAAGGVYYWDTSTWTDRTTNPPRAVAISGLTGADGYAPSFGNQVLVSDIDRHVIVTGADPEALLGTQDKMVIRFSAQEDVTQWRTTETNTAGELRISSGSEIVAAVKTRQQIVVLTNTAVYAMQYVGPPYTFGINQLSGTVTIAGPKAATAVEDTIYWMGSNEFYMYDGAVRQVPCTVRDYVFDDINRAQLIKVVSGSNTADSEIWWHYPSSNVTEPDRYVVYNYAQRIWYYGTLGRTAWVDRGIFDYPMAACPNGCLFQHEYGFDDGSTAPATGIASYIQSSPIDIDQGGQFGFVSRMLPDVSFLNSTASTPTVNLDLKVGNYPGQDLFDTNTGAVARSASTPVELYTTKVDTRLRGRTLALRVESTGVGVTWRLGTPRIDVRTDGRR